MLGKRLLFIGFWLLSFISSAQEVKVSAGFLEEHFKVGEEVHYWMSARYPPQLNLLFPDSLYAFGNFEYLGKTYYPSQMKEGLIYDTVVYRLQSFEIDRVQKLQLPAIILKEGDSLRVFATPDSLLLFELAPQVSDTTQLKTNLNYAAVPRAFNYPLFWIILGVVVVLLGVSALLFGKKIIRAFKLRRMRKEYLRFSDYLTEQIRLLKVDPQPATAEHTLTEWKNYVERLENLPFSTLTSREILQMEFTQELRDPLKTIDRCVYGGHLNENLYKDFQSIEDFTQHRYGKAVADLKNGK